MAARRRLAAVIVALTVGSFVLVLGYAVWRAMRYPDRPGPLSGPAEAKIVIVKGMSLAGSRIYWPTKIWSITRSGSAFTPTSAASHPRSAQAPFAVRVRMTPRQIDVHRAPASLRFRSPSLKGRTSGWRGCFEDAGICKGQRSRAPHATPPLRSIAGVTGGSLEEGYLFPTPIVSRRACCAPVPPALVKRTQRVLGELKTHNFEGMRILNRNYKFGDREIIIMASLVEKRPPRARGTAAHRRSVLNRLRLPTFRPHRLETDPTIIHGCTVPVQRARPASSSRAHPPHPPQRRRKSLQHLYLRGVAARPICNPGRAAMQAVLAPDSTPYLYFVSRNDGTHQSSVTLKSIRRRSTSTSAKRP